MGKIAIKDLQSVQAVVSKALATIKDPKVNPIQLMGPHSYSVIDYDPAGPDV